MAQSVLTGTEEAEKYFFLFGPGYAYFLSICAVVFGSEPLPLLFINILMSALSCLFVYKLANDLTGSYPVAIVSGIIVTTSYTSITLSNTLLSDTLFNMLFAMGLIVYLRAHRSQRWSGFIFAGIVFGAAVLVRAPAQLWQIMMVVISLALLKYDQRTRVWRRAMQLRRIFVKPAICMLISALIISGWVLRNYSVHGVPVVSMSGPM